MLDEKALEAAFAMMQSKKTAEHNDAYKLFREAGEKGATFLIAELSLANEALRIRIFDFLSRMLFEDKLYQDTIVNELFRCIEENPSFPARSQALRTLAYYLMLSQNEKVAQALLPYLLIETDYRSLKALATSYGTQKMIAAVPYLEVLALDSDAEIANLASRTLERIKPSRERKPLPVDDAAIEKLAAQARQKIEEALKKDDKDLEAAFAMMQSEETAEHNDAYKLFRAAGEKGAEFLIANLHSDDEPLTIRIIEFLSRMLILDRISQAQIEEELLRFIAENPPVSARLKALSVLTVHLKFSPNEKLVRALLPYLLSETDYAFLDRLGTYLAKVRMVSAIPYLEVLATDDNVEIAEMASRVLKQLNTPLRSGCWRKDDPEITKLAEQIRQQIEAEEALLNGSEV